MAGRLPQAGLLLALLAAPAGAEYPDRPVTLIVPYPPGGSVDLIGRAMHPRFAAALGAGVVIVNQPGAGGTIGTAKGAAAKPDGYTLTLTTVGPLATQPHLLRLSYGPESFDYVCRTHVTPQVLVVRANAPFRTLRDLVEHGRRDRGAISLSSTGTGSVPHLATIDIGRTAGFEWLHVPHNGDGGALQLWLGSRRTDLREQRGQPARPGPSGGGPAARPARRPDFP
jgi:tripartite-type tricarboxylate transporter receptor subunit TctC